MSPLWNTTMVSDVLSLSSIQAYKHSPQSVHIHKLAAIKPRWCYSTCTK